MIADRIMDKWEKWIQDGNRQPNSIVMPPEEFHEFVQWLLRLGPMDGEPNFNGMTVYASRGATEIKVGILL